MVDQINQAIDIIVPRLDEIHENENDQDEKIINISGYKTNTRPLYRIKRRQYIEIIRQQLKAKHRLLFRTFNTHAFYSCTITEMQEKVVEHMTTTNAYSLIMELNQTKHQHDIEKYLNLIDQRITLTLNNLLHHRSITAAQWRKMKVDRRAKQQLDSLYFLPDTRRKNVPFYPMINYQHGLTIKISHFLSDILQPIYDRITYLKTFNTSMDLIDALEEYTKKGGRRLPSNTRFVALHINNLSTIMRHEQIIQTLQRFLDEYIIDGRIAGISIQNIIDLVRLFLDNQYILYDNKIYQQIRGSAFNSPLTTILANIYLYYWQQDLLTIVDNKNEFFGRCFDDIFFIWNESEDKLNDLFHTMNKQYPDIKMTIEINDTNINYLDLNISHIDGHLKIQVAHDLNIEPYSLPYVFGHPQHQYHTLLEATLLRAARCCTDVFDFANELEDLQLSFQYNGFPEDFFMDQCQLFYGKFKVSDLKLQLGEAYYDQSRYDYLRQKVFNYNQQQKKTRIKRLQRQTRQYRWKH